MQSGRDLAQSVKLGVQHTTVSLLPAIIFVTTKIINFSKKTTLLLNKSSFFKRLSGSVWPGG